MDVKRMDPRRQDAHRINVDKDRSGPIRDRQLMRAAQPGCKTKASGGGRSACQTLGDPRGVRGDSGGRQAPERGPEYERRPSAPEETGCRCRDGGSTRAAIQPIRLWPQRPRGGLGHGADVTAAKPGCRVDQRAMRAALCGNPTGCRRMLGAVPVGPGSEPELCTAGVANRQTNRYSDPLAPGSWQATQRAKARDNAGVLCQERTTLVIGLHVKIANAIACACRQA